MTMVTEDVLLRIGKLLNVTTDRGATPAEAETAMAMAHKLLAQYNLDVDQVEEAHGRQKKTEEVTSGYQKVGKWEVTLFCAVAEANYCKVLRTHRYYLHLIGRKTNMEATRLMFAWISAQGERFWREEYNKVAGQYSNWRTHKAGFYRGFSGRIWSRLEQDKVKAEQTMAIVRVDENQQWIEQHIGKLGRAAKNNRSYDHSAQVAGWIRGGDASLGAHGQLGDGA